ncbi:MAG: CRISPR-associated endoribonuclease Cas6 [Caldithrix sp.]|nr:CRISPR-associated endoribonuclease Cas6 [Caldithrix sp.]
MKMSHKFSSRVGIQFMRIQITFENHLKPTFLPINTNYYLVKLIDSLVYSYKRYLKSLMPAGIKRSDFNLYTFSQLFIPERIIEDFKIGIVSPQFYWYVSSPYYQFLGLIAKELRDNKFIKIDGKRFEVSNVQFITAPSFDKSEAQFTCLSPVTVYKKLSDRCDQGKGMYKDHYLMPEDGVEYYKSLKRDLENKYYMIWKKKYSDIDFRMEFDKKYIKKRRNKISKVIYLNHNEKSPNHVKGVLAPLHNQADPEVLQLIYDAGLGQLNSLGFGMVETVNEPKY